LFTAPRTKGAEDKKTQRTRRKTEKFGHRFSQINAEVKTKERRKEI
jgi:hypothetical protein